MPPSPPPVSPPLVRLAAAMGVMTSYDDYLQRPVDVSAESVRLALAAMGIAAEDDAAAADALALIEAERAQRLVAPTTVLRPGQSRELAVAATVDAAQLELEDGSTLELATGTTRLRLPPDLPLGYHRLVLAAGADAQLAHVIATPGVCPVPLQRPGFGWMVQLYAARSAQSWGLGDLRDLATLAGFSGEVGAAAMLVNPLHAAAPVLPQQPSPYSPTSRRYRNPLYLRIEDVPGYGNLDAATRERLAALGAGVRDAGDRIDRDAVFRAKMEALELLFDSSLHRHEHRERYVQWRAQEGQGLHDFATFCALAERHGTPWQRWPEPLRHPANAAVGTARAQLRDRHELHCWIQWLCVEQLATAQQSATAAGMDVGIIHDLAVGVDPGGADAWSLQDDLATDVSVGAPPDGFNQRGQDWALPPLLPARLPQTGYAPFRDMIRSVLTHAGGVRIDHVMGLWRLWWVPSGRSPADGTYVRYPASDLLGVLSLEAHRAGALVVGEDLGTVESGVREMMAEHRILSSRVLYFERIDDDPQQPMLPAAEYPELAFTSITTHDLPTPAGWWTDTEIAVQAELGLFGERTTPQAESTRKAAERDDMLSLLRSEGLVGEDPDTDELVLAMHRFLARTPSLLVATGLGDAIGDRRQPNMPGTVDEYPNWRRPLARWRDGITEPVLLDDLMADRNVRSVAAALAERAAP
jgi:4-alpha-glucanotransferase